MGWGCPCGKEGTLASPGLSGIGSLAHPPTRQVPESLLHGRGWGTGGQGVRTAGQRSSDAERTRPLGGALGLARGRCLGRWAVPTRGQGEGRASWHTGMGLRRRLRPRAGPSKAKFACVTDSSGRERGPWEDPRQGPVPPPRRTACAGLSLSGHGSVCPLPPFSPRRVADLPVTRENPLCPRPVLLFFPGSPPSPCRLPQHGSSAPRKGCPGLEVPLCSAQTGPVRGPSKEGPGLKTCPGDTGSPGPQP